MIRTELWIGGAWRAGRGERFASIDPARGVEVWAGTAASAEDVADACAAAEAAFGAWAEAPLEARRAVARAFGALIAARAEALARLISEEMGKPLWEARTEAQAVIGKIEISIRAQEERAGSRRDEAAFGYSSLNHRPHGVMAVLGPFNFPAHLPNGHITPALLAGNTVVFKPSETTPAVGAFMAEAWREAGLPAGVLNLVQGGRDVGEALLDAPVAGVLFTGSSHAGVAIHRRFAGRPDVILALEMGGNNPLIAWPPFDVGAAANLVTQSAFVTSGQRCACARRLITPDDAHGAALIEAIGALADGIVVGPGDAEPAPFMGPLATSRAAERAEAAVHELIARGARVVGAPWRREGAFARPLVLDVTGVESPDEEIFAPVLQIRRAPTFTDALGEANATRFGLAGGLLSEDEALWAQAQSRLRVGVLNWNRPTTGASSAMPFGGPGLSGSHRPSAYYAADYCAYPVAAQASPRLAAIPSPGLPEL